MDKMSVKAMDIILFNFMTGSPSLLQNPVFLASFLTNITSYVRPTAA
jgi:hypothetical protein